MFAIGVAIALCGACCRQDDEQPIDSTNLTTESASHVTKRAGPNKVLIVHSYHTGYPWTDAVTQGIRRALAGSEIDLEIFYMDTKRNLAEEWKTKSGAQAHQIVVQWQPDVVIAVDDNAQEYFAKEYAGLESPQIVFCGVNCEVGEYGYPASNVTGVLERPRFDKAIEWMQRVIPAARRIAVIADNSPSSAGALHFLLSSYRCEDSQWELVSCDTPETFPEWKRAVEQCQSRADALLVYTYHTVLNEARSDRVSPREVVSWTVTNCRIPTVGCLVFAIDDGVLIGFVESGIEHGLRAGIMTREILGGASPADIPVVTAVRGQSMINLATARRLGIVVSDEIVREADVVVEE